MTVIPPVPRTGDPREIEKWLQEVERQINSVIQSTGVIFWSNVSKIGSNLSDLETKSHTVLSDIGTNTHAEIDSHILDTSAHGVTGSIVGTSSTQTLSNKTLTNPVITSGQVSSGNLTLNNTPSSDNHAANKLYVDGRFNSLKSDTTQTGNVGTGEDNLIGYTMPANTLGTNGDYIEIDAFGTMAANANNKQLKLYFGSTVIYDSTSLAVNDADFNINCKIIRTAESSQKCIINIMSNNATLPTTSIYTTTTESTSGSITIKCTGEGVSDNDIVQEGLLVRWYPAA
jgi:hypothetical protein